VFFIIFSISHYLRSNATVPPNLLSLVLIVFLVFINYDIGNLKTAFSMIDVGFVLFIVYLARS